MRAARQVPFDARLAAPDELAGKGVHMQWFQHLRNWSAQAKVAEMADDVAAQSFESVWERVYPNVVGMSIEEARGYARARAAIVVSDKIDVAVAQRSHARVNQQRVFALAMDTVVCRTVTHAMAQRSRPAMSRQAA